VPRGVLTVIFPETNTFMGLLGRISTIKSESSIDFILLPLLSVV
jgi:hypothetical protein